MKRTITAFLFIIAVLCAKSQNTAISVMEFNIDDIPCRWYPETNLLYLCGFDVDEGGLMYFAGGDPLQIACYNGSNQVYKRTILNAKPQQDLFHIKGDSIFIVDDTTSKIIRLHKNGKGSICESKIEMDRIEGGWFDDNGITLYNSIPTITLHGDTILWLKSVISYDYSLKTTNSTDASLSTLHFLRNNIPLNISDKNNYFDKGCFNDKRVYWHGGFWPGGEIGELLLMDIDGNIVDTFSHHDNNSYTYPVMGKYDGRELSTISQEFNVRRGDYLYAIGYNGTEKKVFVYKMKLSNIFPN